MRYIHALSFRTISAAALIFITPLALPGCLAPAGDIIASIRASAAHQSFNIALWEGLHVPDILAALTIPPKDPGAIDDYFEQSARLREANARVEWLLATRSAHDSELGTALSEQAEAEGELAELRPLAVGALHGMTSRAMYSAGLTSDLPLVGEIVFPPLSFVMEELPRALIVSPRDRIKILESLPLRSDISRQEILRLEDALEKKGVSAIVETIGGLGTYPALVKATSTREFTVQIILHEWVHHYLFFYPLGRRYSASGEMTTINETVANMVAAETTALALGLSPPLFRVPEPAGAPQRESGVLNFTEFMRETRMEVDRLLEEGQIEEAEAYMEDRRVLLNENHGYRIRKINQAYFAFHGSYADSPAGSPVSPIYGQLIAVRNMADSTATFLRAVRGIRSPGDLERLAAAQRK